MYQPSSSSYKFSAPVMQISSSPNPPSGYLLHTWKRASNFLQCPCVKDCDYQTLDSTTMMVTNTWCKYPGSDNAWTDREVVLSGITEYQVKLLQPPTCEERKCDDLSFICICCLKIWNPTKKLFSSVAVTVECFTSLTVTGTCCSIVHFKRSVFKCNWILHCLSQS